MQIFHILFLITLISAYPKSAEEYQNQVKRIIDSYAEYYKIGWSFAIVHENMNFTYAAGPNDIKNDVSLKVEDKIPLGSFTKMFTTMSILKYVEEGKMHLNDTLSSRCDKWLWKTNGTSLLEIFQGDEKINQVTLFQLMTMTSGLEDIDDLPTFVN